MIPLGRLVGHGEMPVFEVVADNGTDLVVRVDRRLLDSRVLSLAFTVDGIVGCCLDTADDPEAGGG